MKKAGTKAPTSEYAWYIQSLSSMGYLKGRTERQEVGINIVGLWAIVINSFTFFLPLECFELRSIII
jgi:hypothetical protein